MATVKKVEKPKQLTKTQRAKIKANEKKISKIVGASHAKKIMSRAAKLVKAGKKDIKDIT